MKKLCITTGKEWHLAEAEFKQIGFHVERFDAIVEDNRPLAFNKSVYECMKLAEGQDLLLFEDDVVFDSPFIYGSIEEIPEDFMSYHLGGNIIGTSSTIWKMPERHSNHLARIHNIWQSHATLYSAECVKYILDHMNPNVIDEKNHIFDDWLRLNVLPMGRSYVLNPMICYQRPKVSEIWGTFADYTGCHKQGNEWLKNNL